MTHGPYISPLLGEADFWLFDVGAAHGLLPHLEVLQGAARIVLFEPDPQAYRQLEAQYADSIAAGRTRILDSALSGTGGKRTLYVTNVPTGSSLLKPGSSVAQNYADPNYIHPLREVAVETKTLAELCAGSGIPAPSLIKLDVQGAELEVLQGLGDGLSETLGIELEIGMPGAYLDQPQFSDIDRFLRNRDFELYDVRTANVYRPKNGRADYYQTEVFSVCANSPSISARLWEFDAVYFRKADAILAARDTVQLRRLIVAYCTYNFFSEAYWLIEQAELQGLIPEAAAPALKQAVVGWHGTFGRISLYRNSWFAARLRRFLSRLAPRNSPRWCKYMFQEYP